MIKRGRYTFHEAVLDDDHFVRRYVRYAFEQCSSPADYHEGLALLLLSLVSAGLKIQMAHLPFGMRTNLYLLLYGETFRSRKSTAMDYCEDIIREVLPDIVLPGDYSPQGLGEQVALRDHGPCVMMSDEFHKIIGQIHNVKWMTGLREFFLTMYSKGTYQYSRTAKGGKTKTADEIVVEDCHMCIAGNITPAIKRSLKEEDVETGFLNRFAFIAPKDRPDPIPFAMLQQRNQSRRSQMILYLSDMRKAVLDLIGKKKTNIGFDVSALNILDQFQQEIDMAFPDEQSISIAARSIDYAMKLSALIAIGSLSPINLVRPPTVKEIHVHQAIDIVRRWMKSGVEIVSGMAETEDEKVIEKITRDVEINQVVYRTDVVRKYRLPKWKIDQILDTMVDRNLVKVFYAKKKGSHRESEVWAIPNYGEEPIEVEEKAL